MSTPIISVASRHLVIGLASSALFNLEASEAVFQANKGKGNSAYRDYQRAHENDPLEPGVAFPFVKRLLSLNDIAASEKEPLVEVILLSKNNPDTGLRVMNSIRHHRLDIRRAAFLEGRSPHQYLRALGIDLFLSGDLEAVRAAVAENLPAGQVMQSGYRDDTEHSEVRIAFDFDGVLADDSSERTYAEQGLKGFRDNEVAKAEQPIDPGPLAAFLHKISRIQTTEMEHKAKNPAYTPRVRSSIVTARGAPSEARVIHTLRAWGVMVNEAFFLDGYEKPAILDVLKPHIFFDDQKRHLEGAAERVGCVHIPFGIRNRPAEPPDKPADAG